MHTVVCIGMFSHCSLAVLCQNSEYSIGRGQGESLEVNTRGKSFPILQTLLVLHLNKNLLRGTHVKIAHMLVKNVGKPQALETKRDYWQINEAY